MKNIKVVFVDIDWTLFDHKNNCFNKSGIEAMKQLKQKKIKVILCTARPFHSLYQLGTLFQFEPDGYIVSNGGALFYQNKLIHETTFKKEEVRQIIKVAKENKLALEYTTSTDRFAISKKTKEVDLLFSTFKEVAPPIKDYEGEEVVSILLFASEENDEQLIKTLPKSIVFSRFSPYSVDIIPEVREKGNAVKYMLSFLNIDKKDALAIGDDLGDISMFNEVGFSICLGNGKPLAKQASSYVSDNIWDDGVYKALKHLKII